MQTYVSMRRVARGLKLLSKKIFIRSDVYDRLLLMAKHDAKLAFILSKNIDATKKLDRRIKEANMQGNAALIWDTWSARGIGKSWLNYLIIFRILTSREVKNWKNQIVFKVGDEVINTASRWTEGIKIIANQIQDIDEGGYWGLMQDELSSEWGEGRVKQAESQKDAVNELRKLGISCAFASPQLKEGWDFDFRLFSIGYNKKTRVSAAILYFQQAQGIIFLKMPNHVYNFLKKHYDIDARKHVLAKAKNGFFTETIKPDSEDKIAIHDNNQHDVYHFDGNRFKLLRDIFKSFWENTFDVNTTYARLLTSLYLWEKQFHYSGSQGKREIDPAHITIDNLPLTEAAGDWVDEVGKNSLMQAKSNYQGRYEKIPAQFDSHHKESIGETYAQTVLQNEIEQLNLPPQHSYRVRKQHRDGYIKEGGKPYDAAITDGSNAAIAFNHKFILIKYKRGKKQGFYDSEWGISPHPFSVLWYTYTRPFREYYFIKIDLSLSLDVFEKGGLVAQDLEDYSRWKEVTWEKLQDIIGRYLGD